MDIRIQCMGMALDAEVRFIPGYPSTFEEPGCDDEIEVLSLYCDGKDASFLLQSWLRDDILYAALCRAGDVWDEAQHEAEINELEEGEMAL